MAASLSPFVVVMAARRNEATREYIYLQSTAFSVRLHQLEWLPVGCLGLSLAARWRSQQLANVPGRIYIYTWRAFKGLRYGFTVILQRLVNFACLHRLPIHARRNVRLDCWRLSSSRSSARFDRSAARLYCSRNW